MLRLTGLDAAFVYDERPREPQHTLKLAVLGREASARASRADFLALLRARLPELPPLRWRVLRVPADLHHPVCVDDPDLDLEAHVRHLALPAPGGRDALCAVVSEIASQPLDPDRPLWELWLLEGYEGGRTVALLKLSHALADGAASRRLLERLFAPPDAAASASRSPGPAAPLPSRGRLAWSALRAAIRDLWTALPRLVAASAMAARRLRRAGAPRSFPLVGSPATPFSGPLSRRRSFHFASVPLAEAKQLGRSFGATLNDVVVAVSAGAVRGYLAHHRALPGLPTLGHMPASTRAAGELEDWGNRITARPFGLPTHLADPVARLEAARAECARVKAELALRAGAHLEEWLRWLPPFAPKLVSRLVRTLMRLRPDLPGGVTVSNVRGPAALHAPGGPIEDLVSVGHMKYVAGLNITVWSYGDRLNFGLYACARAVPDLWRLSAGIGEAFEELAKAAAREESRVKPCV